MRLPDSIAAITCGLLALALPEAASGRNDIAPRVERKAPPPQPYKLDVRYRLANDANPLGHLPYADLINRQALLAGLDPALMHAVIMVESGYNARALSPKGAVGLMQLMPDTARRYGVVNSQDPRQNMAGGAAYLRDLLGLFGQDLSLALAAYNAGEGEVMRRGNRIPPFAETRAYVPKVIREYETLRKESGQHRSPYQLSSEWTKLLSQSEEIR